MKISGIMKVMFIIVIDFLCIYYIAGAEISIILISVAGIYAWLGGYLDIYKNHGWKADKGLDYESIKFVHSYIYLSEYIFEKEGINVKNVKLYILPSNDINAFACGFRHIAVTRGVLKNIDEMTLSAILAHEISHIINLDVVFKRIAFFNVFIIMVYLTILSTISNILIWGAFFVLCLFGICKGAVSMFIVSEILKVLKAFFSGIQKIIVVIFQVIIGIISRHSEYRADNYAVQLGYGLQLQYFLNRFTSTEEQSKRTLQDVLYDTHPAPEQRITKIQKEIAELL